MYWEWSSLLGTGETGTDEERASVLEKLPPEAAKEVVIPVVRNIVQTLGISQPPSASSFEADNEIEWCLQVVCFGLGLPLTDHEIIKDCVNIYCEWLSCLSPTPKISVPKPIVERPTFYSRKMIRHLYHLFTPRKGEGQDMINRQAVLCHRVLRTLQMVIRSSTCLDTETWECILLFLISVNHSILSPPTLKEDIGDQLCDRVLGVLYEIWLLACEKSFPSPSLWKTLRETCKAWRHRPNLFEQWNRINLLLTSRTIAIMYGPDYYRPTEDDGHFQTGEMSNDCVIQTWFRFLHSIGNPVELTKPTIISQTQNFLHYAIASDAVVDPCAHPCLSILPSIFHSAMKGISNLVDAFLGIPPRKRSELIPPQISITSAQIQPIRRLAKSFSIAPSSNTSLYKGLPRNSIFGLPIRSKDTSSIPSSSQTSLQSTNSFQIQPHIEIEPTPLPSHSRPKVNSILHLFGPWLFEAALISNGKQVGDNRRTSRGSVPLALPENVDIPLSITIDKYYLGRAEALGTLCRIFCSKKTGEEILPAYLARFYMAIREGLKENKNEVLSAILSNSTNILRSDLDGVSLLIPDILKALEHVLPSKDSIADLRRSAITILLSILPLPLHFLNVPIKDLLDKSKHITTFIQLKPRIGNLLINSLQAEVDSTNIQMLLGGLLMFVTDMTAFEESDKNFRPSDSSPNLSENASIRSYCDTHSVNFDEASEIDGQNDTAQALFVRSVYLVCHRLVTSWKSDLPVTLATFELLSGLARLKIPDRDPNESKQAVKWICDFIIHQCSRAPPAHSKDLHSSIVAAFQCVTVWLMTHSHILEDKDMLLIVLEVVEYGISGTKSMVKGEAPKLKDEKDLKPVSLRVRDAAEALLAVIFEQVGNPSPQTDADVEETFLLKQISSVPLSKSESIPHFRYFIIDRSILVAILEESQSDETEPALKLLIRSPTGRYAWSFQQRYAPKSRAKPFSDTNPGRPLPINDLGIFHDIKPRYFPESLDRVTATCKADKAIPTLESVCASSDAEALELNRLSIILENQIRQEKRIAQLIKEEAEKNYPNLEIECSPPLPAAQKYISARLFLSSFGFLPMRIDDPQNTNKLVLIDSGASNFAEELDSLDSLSCKTKDTVYLFYVRNGQQKSKDILANALPKQEVPPHFIEFILSLGWPVKLNKLSDAKHHEGNKRETSVGNMQSMKSHIELHQGFNGESQALYWTDVSSELLFIVPTFDMASSVWNAKEGPESQNSEEKDGKDKSPQGKAPTKSFDSKIFVVWLESLEDKDNFPLGDLINNINMGKSSPIEPILIIFIHEMGNGLLRIHLQGTSHNRLGIATPLVDGMGVSRRVIGTLVRQTSLNMSRRKRLENESFQPPHVKRKLKIQEILQKFPSVLSQSEFYTQFFRDPLTMNSEEQTELEEDLDDKSVSEITV